MAEPPVRPVLLHERADSTFLKGPWPNKFGYTRLVLGFTFILAAILILGLGECGLSRSSSYPALEKWLMAINHKPYERAAALVVNDPATVATWIEETQRLAQQHGGVKGVGISNVTTSDPFDPPFLLTKWTWNDGYERCLRVQETNEGRVRLLDTTYQDCATIPLPEYLRSP